MPQSEISLLDAPASIKQKEMTAPNQSLDPDAQRVFDSVARLAGSTGVNPTTVAYALPTLDVYAIIQQLVDCGILEKVGGAVRIGDFVPPPNAEPNTPAKTPLGALSPGAAKFAEPRRRSRALTSHDSTHRKT